SASSTPIPRVTVQDPPTDGGFVPDRLFAAGGAVGGGFSVFRPRLQNTFQERQQFFAMNGIGNGFRGLLPTGQPSTAQSQTINGANPQGLFPTGQPSTLQSLAINPAFPDLHPGAQVPSHSGFVPFNRSTWPMNGSFNMEGVQCIQGNGSVPFGTPPGASVIPQNTTVIATSPFGAPPGASPVGGSSGSGHVSGGGGGHGGHR